MTDNNPVDVINRETMRLVAHEYAYSDTLTKPEQSALASVIDEIRHKRILDIGVGGGRTVKALREISDDYIGIDYVQKMVDHCRRRFPGVRFEKADARSMPQFEDRSFDLVVFACNGICMVDHEGRIAILKEVRRVLRPGGVFIFSTYNQHSRAHDEFFVLPEWRKTGNPLRFTVRAIRFLFHLANRLFNRTRYKRYEIRNADYSIINDRCHDYRTMLYYITLEKQRKQLQALGFQSNPRGYDLSGKVVGGDTPDDSITFVTRVSQ